MKMELFIFKEFLFHKFDEVRNAGPVHVIKNGASDEYITKNIKNFTFPSQKLMA